MPGDKSARLEKLAEEMERQLQRPLTPEERHCLALYLEAGPEDEQAASASRTANSSH